MAQTTPLNRPVGRGDPGNLRSSDDENGTVCRDPDFGGAAADGGSLRGRQYAGGDRRRGDRRERTRHHHCREQAQAGQAGRRRRVRAQRQEVHGPAQEHHRQSDRDGVGRADLPGSGGRWLTPDRDEHQLHRAAEHDPEQAAAGYHRRAQAGRPDQGPQPRDPEDGPGRQGPNLRRAVRGLLGRARLQPRTVQAGSPR